MARTNEFIEALNNFKLNLNTPAELPSRPQVETVVEPNTEIPVVEERVPLTPVKPATPFSTGPQSDNYGTDHVGALEHIKLQNQGEKPVDFTKLGDMEYSLWDYLKPDKIRDDTDPDDKSPPLTTAQKIMGMVGAVGTGGLVAAMGGGILPILAAGYLGKGGVEWLLQNREEIETDRVALPDKINVPSVLPPTKPEPKITTPDNKEIQRNPFDTQKGNTGGRDGSSADKGTGNRTAPTKTDYSGSVSPHAEAAKRRESVNKSKSGPRNTTGGTSGGRDGSSADKGTANRTSNTRKDDHASVPR